MVGLRATVFAVLAAVMPSVVHAGSGEEKARAQATGYRAPAFYPLPLGSVRPSGWLKNQLRIQAGGLSGHLDEFWPDIKQSAWIGGKAEGWERVPYWLDGVVPLAYLLDDDVLKGKVKRYVDYILDHQQADGWLGPVGDGKHPAYDPWPLFVLFKALTQYHEATGDPRVIPAMRRCVRRVDEVITRSPLTSWGKFRTADLIVSLDWLYEKTCDPWLLELAAKVHRQGFDWRGLYARFPFTGRTQGKFELDTHGVNTAMALKNPGLWYRHSSDEADRDGVYNMLSLLDKYHGQATGVFTCDEHLAGREPFQGTELCTVVEEMYSLETLVSVLGYPKLADRLERVAFNALPATFKPDMCAHQYDQQANQVVCKLSPERVYVDNGPDSNLFGLEPNFGCCTANMHQGWPKLTTHLWMMTPDPGLAGVVYAPCVVETTVNKVPVRVEVETDYPFRDHAKITVRTEKKVRFPLWLRLPGWAASSFVAFEGQPPSPDAKPGTFYRVEREWQGVTTLGVGFSMTTRLWNGVHDSVAVERGPLVFALRVGAEWKRLKGNPPFADWEVFPTTPWNYALRIDREHPGRSVRYEERPVGPVPFSPDGAPVLAKVEARRVPGWTLARNAAGPAPQSPVDPDTPPETVTLVPYGCTDLRITEFPTLK
jgi:hypothetical protein